LEEGQEKNDEDQFDFGGFSKFVTQRSFVQSFGGFFDHRFNQAGYQCKTFILQQQYQTDYWVYFITGICFIATMRLV
jgi:hypothetical protein